MEPKFRAGDRVRVDNLGGGGPADAVVSSTYLGVGTVTIDVISGPFVGNTTGVKPERLKKLEAFDLVEVCLPDGTEIKSDPDGDEAATFAQDAHGRELSRGAAVEVLAGEDAGQRGRVQDVTGQYVTVTFPDGSALRTAAGNVRCMSAVSGPVACPYCAHSVTMDAWQRLGDHRTFGGLCDGSRRHVERKDVNGRAVFAAPMRPTALPGPKVGDTVNGGGKVVSARGDEYAVEYPQSNGTTVRTHYLRNEMQPDGPGAWRARSFR